jgi:hypothetical protein
MPVIYRQGTTLELRRKFIQKKIANPSIICGLVRYWRRKIPNKGKEESSMPKYMLLLRDDRELFGKLGPEEMQKTIEKYYAWRNKPFVVDGAGLMEKTGRVMQKKNGSVSVTAGPYSESKEVMGGYYTIEAVNFDEAVKLAADNPHVNFGTIEIREVAHRAA